MIGEVGVPAAGGSTQCNQLLATPENNLLHVLRVNLLYLSLNRPDIGFLTAEQECVERCLLSLVILHVEHRLLRLVLISPAKTKL